MQQPLVKRIPFAKILIGLALAFLLSLGLCGVTLVMAVGGGSANSQISKMVDPLGMVVAVGMLGSLAALIVTCVAWVVLSIVAGTATKVSQPLKLSKNEDDTKLDKDL